MFRLVLCSIASLLLASTPSMACAHWELRDEAGNVLRAPPDPLIVFGIKPVVSDPLLAVEEERLSFQDVIIAETVARLLVPVVAVPVDNAVPQWDEDAKVTSVLLACDGSVLSETVL